MGCSQCWCVCSKCRLRLPVPLEDCSGFESRAVADRGGGRRFVVCLEA